MFLLAFILRQRNSIIHNVQQIFQWPNSPTLCSSWPWIPHPRTLIKMKPYHSWPQGNMIFSSGNAVVEIIFLLFLPDPSDWKWLSHKTLRKSTMFWFLECYPQPSLLTKIKLSRFPSATKSVSNLNCAFEIKPECICLNCVSWCLAICGQWTLRTLKYQFHIE